MERCAAEQGGAPASSQGGAAGDAARPSARLPCAAALPAPVPQSSCAAGRGTELPPGFQLGAPPKRPLRAFGGSRAGSATRTLGSSGKCQRPLPAGATPAASSA
eukprot:2322702-Prymnesium_polylepis.1